VRGMPRQANAKPCRVPVFYRANNVGLVCARRRFEARKEDSLTSRCLARHVCPNYRNGEIGRMTGK